MQFGKYITAKGVLASVGHTQAECFPPSMMRTDKVFDGFRQIVFVG